ncbi:hypothetical protein [Xenorhabdus hominickii]
MHPSGIWPSRYFDKQDHLIERNIHMRTKKI